ncbi:carboxypeptidase-like regulatory domain-containing protein [Planctomicrobium sp. SH661]|uniref:carboxypeptidase-like regulatory domain-containing protein n=1 Tax=Planctomicrobium sp. SH661 TaxID=3448124 RepID=UPI003F5C70DB
MPSTLLNSFNSCFHRKSSAALLGLTLLLASGCGAAASREEKATVGGISGKVTFEGKPVTEGQVVFTNSEINTEVPGNLDAQGNYSVNGVVVGEALVSVRPLPPPTSMDVNAPKVKPADPADIPKKYRSAKTSGLKLQVEKGAMTFDIDMKP